MCKPNLLVTGGLGNLGSWIVQEAVKSFEVTVLSRSSRDVIIDGDYTLILADLADEQQLYEKLKGLEFQYVIHAGSVNDGFVDNYMPLSYSINAFGTRYLLKALNLDVIKHFIYLSTFQVYGTYEGVITEETKTQPKNDYGMSHLLAEYFLSMDLKDLKYSVIRLTNSYGCPKDLATSKWYLILNDLSKSAFYKREIKLGGNGKARRDFIWMGDVCSALLKLLMVCPLNEVYNLSREHTLSMSDVAENVQSAYQEYYGALLPIYFNESDKSVPDQSLAVSSKKIKTRISLDYQDKLFEEAIRIFRLLEMKN
jgi:UDP-glucose 4-epimerase